MGLRSKNYEKALREANKAFRSEEEHPPSRIGEILAFGLVLLFIIAIIAY